jgi:DNA repair protein RecN (Recombination protein N)
VLVHLATAQERLSAIETSEEREQELRRRISELTHEFVAAAASLHDRRAEAAARLQKQVEKDLRGLALDKARFEIKLEDGRDDETAYSATGFDRAEFMFSANPGESVKAIGKVASGGEASRLMLVLKTAARERVLQKTAVFDEIDVGIGGRVAEAVGRRLRELSRTQQVLCVTHQPQIAYLADHHFTVNKSSNKGRTSISVAKLNAVEKVEEIARMLAGENITDAARENAKAMLATV